MKLAILEIVRLFVRSASCTDVDRVLQNNLVMTRQDSGFSLVETLIATSITIVALSGLAQLFVVSASANARAKSGTVATILAQDKVEELVAPGGETGDGVDFLDSHGRLIGSDTAPPGAFYIRRWSVQPLSEGAATCLLQVSVSHIGGGEDVRIAGATRSCR